MVTGNRFNVDIRFAVANNFVFFHNVARLHYMFKPKRKKCPRLSSFRVKCLCSFCIRRGKIRMECLKIFIIISTEPSLCTRTKHPFRYIGMPGSCTGRIKQN